MTTIADPHALAEPDESGPVAGPLIDVFANLLPNEIVASRRLAELKKRMAAGLGALAAVLVLIYGFSWVQTASAHSSLSSAKHTAAQLEKQKASFGPLVAAQTEASSIQQALRMLMVGDLSWTDMMGRLQKAGGANITITQVSGTMNSSTTPSGSGVGVSVLNETGQQPVGTVTIDGSAADKNTVAAFVDGLATVPGLAAPYPASVAVIAGSHQVTFTVNVLVTSSALGGRFAAANAPANATTGGH